MTALFTHILKFVSPPKVEGPLSATARYPEGWQTTSRLAGVFGSEPAQLQLLAGEAPAIRRLGFAPFSILRRSGPQPLETCFAWVHETSSHSPKVKM